MPCLSQLHTVFPLFVLSVCVTSPQGEAAAVYLQGMEDYSGLKQRSLLLAAALTLSGSVIASVLSGAGIQGGLPFAVGGAAGLLYQVLLQAGAEAAVPISGQEFIQSGARGESMGDDGSSTSADAQVRSAP